MMSFALLGAGWVLWLLVLLSIGCIAVSLERAVYLIRDRADAGGLASAVNGFLSSGDVSGLRSALGQVGGFESRVLSAGLELAPHGVEAAEKAMAGTVTAEKMRMERGLSFLATVGSNAPFIGLLLLIEAALAIIGLYAQQLNVSILAMPAKSMAGIAFLLIYLPTLLELGNGQILQLADLKHLLSELVHLP